MPFLDDSTLIGAAPTLNIECDRSDADSRLATVSLLNISSDRLERLSYFLWAIEYESFYK